jgi:hypothetical protein
VEPGDLPQFNDDEQYILTGATLNLIINYIKEKTIVIKQGSGLKIDEVGPNGTFPSIDGTDECPS